MDGGGENNNEGLMREATRRIKRAERKSFIHTDMMHLCFRREFSVHMLGSNRKMLVSAQYQSYFCRNRLMNNNLTKSQSVAIIISESHRTLCFCFYLYNGCGGVPDWPDSLFVLEPP